MAFEGIGDVGKEEIQENFEQFAFEELWDQDTFGPGFDDFLFTGEKIEESFTLSDQAEEKLSDSSLSENYDDVSSPPKSPTPNEKKRKLSEDTSTDKDVYINELERRMKVLAKENGDLRKQLANVNRVNRSLRSRLQPIAYPQQPFLLTFAHNIQDAFTVSHAGRSRASSTATLCIFFLLGAFFLPGLLNNDFDNNDLAMLSGSDVSIKNLALPASESQTLPSTLSSLQQYGRNLLALPMAESERRDRDAVFMCPKVVSILKDDHSDLQYISVVLPTGAISKDPNNTFTELICEVRATKLIEDLAGVTLKSTEQKHQVHELNLLE